MEINVEFKEFYKTELKYKLEKIEKERLVFENKMKKDRKKGVIIALGIALLVSIGVQAMQEEGSFTDFLKAFAIFAPVFSLFGWGFGSHFAMKKMLKLKKPFKEKIVAPIIDHFNSNLKYQPEKSITKEEIKDSELFQENIEYYNGDDLFEGSNSFSDYRFSEMRLGVKVKKPDKDGHMRDISHAIFKGVFLVADFQKIIIDSLIIRPNPSFKEENDKKRFIQKGSKFQKEFAKNKYTHWYIEDVKTSQTLRKVETGDGYFDEQFLIYSSDEEKAKTLLEGGLMDFFLKITDWEKEQTYNDKIEGHLQGNYQFPTIYFSIIGNKAYFGKPFDRNFFSPDLLKSIVDEERTAKFYQEIKELNLLMEQMTQIIPKATSNN
ncbi:DUF3137 domain-containing protein [Marivirga salinae]|uniref:DUF3137 domain-containing protein n=1 Tax=Marivirga salinarum TaxID=3059078 RepID=A0AA51NC46_9BACT|nr:DUF3137 domain-containing protein [Marivirga sp. BDSF4-3]WMN12234.1 DUF3137 domain-containing protein [Marivirga sp. BDSF4-3]